MMWETAYRKLLDKDHKILLSSKVVSIDKNNDTYEVTIQSGEVFEAKKHIK